jgi:homoserine O-acetyltransferase
VDTDLLFPVEEQRFLAEHIPDAAYAEIRSRYGHDGFLIETDQLEQLLRPFFEE